MTAATAEVIEPEFGVGDRLKKSRVHCGIKSAADMARRINARLGDDVAKESTINAWEKGTNQPTRIRMDELVRVWVDICNEAGAPLNRATSLEFVYGLRTGSFSPELVPLTDPIQQLTMLEDLDPVDFYRRAELCSV